MAWTYSNWKTLAEVTLAEVNAKLERLRLHMQEVSEKVQPDVSADGRSRSTGQVQAYLDSLDTHEMRLQNKATRLGGGRVSTVRFIRPD